MLECIEPDRIGDLIHQGSRGPQEELDDVEEIALTTDMAQKIMKGFNTSIAAFAWKRQWFFLLLLGTHYTTNMLLGELKGLQARRQVLYMQ